MILALAATVPPIWKSCLAAEEESVFTTVSRKPALACITSFVVNIAESAKMTASPTASVVVEVVVAAVRVTLKLTVATAPAATEYDAGAGAVQLDGSEDTETLPLPVETLLTPYEPFAAVVAIGSAAPPDGVTTTCALATPPPRLLKTIPETLPKCGPVGESGEPPHPRAARGRAERRSAARARAERVA